MATLSIHAPATGELLGEVETTTPDEVRAVVARAKKAQAMAARLAAPPPSGQADAIQNVEVNPMARTAAGAMRKVVSHGRSKRAPGGESLGSIGTSVAHG